MNLVRLREELEADFFRRAEEILALQYAVESAPGEATRRLLRKAFVVTLYAHLEGFVKFALAGYVRYVNQQELVAAELAPPLAASGFADAFTALQSGKKEKAFSRLFPDDAALHGLARRAVFVETFRGRMAKPVQVDDSVLYTANLSAPILRKLLYIVGLPHDMFSPHEATISRLVEWRNGIAHGTRAGGFEDFECRELWLAVQTVAIRLAERLLVAAREGEYLHPSRR